MKFNVIPISKLPKKKKRKNKKKSQSTIFGLRRCTKCLRVKTLPNYDEDNFICEECFSGEHIRGYADYVREAVEYINWKEKYPNSKPCEDCKSFYPDYVMSFEFGKHLCANCFLIRDAGDRKNE
jgi:hypothetical protein